MTTTIWIEPVKRTSRGLLLRARLGGPEGDILCDGVPNAHLRSPLERSWLAASPVLRDPQGRHRPMPSCAGT
jgi:hypothetical protein